MNDLGGVFEFGIGIPKNLATALVWYVTLAQRCRESCREWAPTSLADNKCVTCFQTLIACSASRAPPDGQDDADSKGCLAGFADCTANCRGQTAPASATSSAARERHN
jgi:hypothetical protein